MNILECQALGTPVISTDFLAMGDFTKFGIAVPPVQMDFMKRGVVACPDVAGVAVALAQVENGTFAAHAEFATAAEVGAWVDAHFAPAVVGRRFQRLIRKAARKHKERKAAEKARTAVELADGSTELYKV